jgi:outer membrane protein
MNRKRKTMLICLLMLLIPLTSFAEQLTKVGILDIEKVYSIYFRESKTVKQFQDRQANMLQELSRIDDEILRLENAKLEAENRNDGKEALKLDQEIFEKKQYREDYKRIKTEQLKRMSEELYQSNEFLDELLEAINFVAESEGFSLILNNSRQYRPFFFFYTKEIDITEKVIEELMRRSGQSGSQEG